MVRIITYSTSSIPQDIRAELGIEVASLIINRNGEELVELETDLDAFYKDIYEMADNIPTSSQPPLGKVREIVESIAKTGDEASTFSKCRTQKKALAKMLQVLGEDTAPSGLKNLVVHYIGSKAPAMQWAEEKVAPLIGFMPRVVPASPVIGVHVGPAMGIAYECNAPIPNKFHNSEPEIIVC